jgi:hypothetical protein
MRLTQQSGTVQRGGRSTAGFATVGVSDSALPSGNAALRAVRGEKGGWIDVASTMLARSALMATGLAIAGFRGKQLLKGTVAAGLAVETFVLAWAWRNK